MVASEEEQHVFEVQLYLGIIKPEAVQVQLYAEGINGDKPECIEMTQDLKLVGAENCYRYVARLKATRPATDYTARVLPHRTGSVVPLENSRILWQK